MQYISMKAVSCLLNVYQVEPQLKYERVGNDVMTILARDSASCLAVHSKVTLWLVCCCWLMWVGLVGLFVWGCVVGFFVWGLLVIWYVCDADWLV
jgi:hypothetical protein